MAIFFIKGKHGNFMNVQKKDSCGIKLYISMQWKSIPSLKIILKNIR